MYEYCTSEPVGFGINFYSHNIVSGMFLNSYYMNIMRVIYFFGN